MQHSMIKLISPADLISMLNALFGLIAIFILSISSMRQTIVYQGAFTFILLALLADGLDGFVARKTRKGTMGPYLESMADMTSTGIATSLFVFHLYAHQFSDQSLLIFMVFIGVLIVYLLCGILRLAAFHPLQTTNYFIGIPAPAAALILLTCSYITLPLLFCTVIVFFTSILMISPIPLPKPSNKLNAFTAILIVSTIVFNIHFNKIFIWILLIATVSYLIFGPFYYYRNKHNKTI